MEKERWSNIKLIKTNASRNSRAWTDNPRPEGSYYSNESIVLLMELFGHSSMAITKKYLGIREREIFDVYDSLSF